MKWLFQRKKREEKRVGYSELEIRVHNLEKEVKYLKARVKALEEKYNRLFKVK